jgi:hypothetical protein
MRAVEIPDRDMMCDHAAESLARKPPIKMKCRWLDFERWFAQVFKIQESLTDGATGKISLRALPLAPKSGLRHLGPASLPLTQWPS